jgi:peptide-methionine (S)-S-oxide reductase
MKNKRDMKWMSIITIIFAFSSCSNAQIDENKKMINESKNMDTITLGAGCFWCIEAVFSELKGVESVVAGYAGGFVKNPSYKEVCSGTTGHAEVAQITYNSSLISLGDILEVFWKTHDPTTLNRQGADVGTQYRSAIFYHNDKQGNEAKSYKVQLIDSEAWENPIVTEILPISNYSAAENYHQNYYSQNPGNSYCTFVIQPKLDKFRKVFASKLK